MRSCSPLFFFVLAKVESEVRELLFLYRAPGQTLKLKGKPVSPLFKKVEKTAKHISPFFGWMVEREYFLPSPHE